MVVSEVKNMFKNQYVDIEYYRSNDNHSHIITFNMEYCTGIDACEVTNDMEVIAYQLMNEQEYNENLLANSGITCDFDDWYGDKTAKVLCILLA